MRLTAGEIIKRGIRSFSPGFCLQAGCLALAFAAISLPARAASTGAITALAFSPDGKQLAVGGYTRVTLMDTAAWKPAGTLSGLIDSVRALAFQPDGKLLAIGAGLPGRSGTTCFWDGVAAKPGLSLPEHKDTIDSLCYNKDGKGLLLGSSDGRARSYGSFPTLVSSVLDEHNGRVTATAFPSDGDLNVFVTGAMDKIVKVWDATTPKPHTVINFDQSTAGITGLAFFNGVQFIGSSLDGNLYWWGIDFNKKKRVFNGYHFRTIHAHENGTLCLAISKNRARIITGGMDNLTIVWKADDGGRLKEFKEATQPIYAVALSPDGKLAASGGQEGLVRVWDVESGKLVSSFNVTGAPEKQPEVPKTPDPKTVTPAAATKKSALLPPPGL